MANSEDILPINSEITTAIQKLHLDITSPRAASVLTSHLCLIKGVHHCPPKKQTILKKAIRSKVNALISQKYTSGNGASCRFL